MCAVIAGFNKLLQPITDFIRDFTLILQLSSEVNLDLNTFCLGESEEASFTLLLPAHVCRWRSQAKEELA